MIGMSKKKKSCVSLLRNADSAIVDLVTCATVEVIRTTDRAND